MSNKIDPRTDQADKKPMTWARLKAIMEGRGVDDMDPIWLIDLEFAPGCNHDEEAVCVWKDSNGAWTVNN